MLNTMKIKARMKELGYGMRDLSRITGLSASCLSSIINNRREANTVNVQALKEGLSIGAADLNDYFFCSGVAIHATNKSLCTVKNNRDHRAVERE